MPGVACLSPRLQQLVVSPKRDGPDFLELFDAGINHRLEKVDPSVTEFTHAYQHRPALTLGVPEMVPCFQGTQMFWHCIMAF
jgi:hypothetical protein